VDEETGEFLPGVAEKIEELMKQRGDILEGISLTIKNLRADIAAINAEIQTLLTRVRPLTNRANRLEDFLEYKLAGETINTPRVVVKYTKSQRVAIAEGKTWHDFDARFIRQKDPESNREAIKAALKAGEEVPWATLETRKNMQIK
jgi:hypothetical protein